MTQTRKLTARPPAPKGSKARTEADCPACESGVLMTKDSRTSTASDVIRRRRKACNNCGYRCSTHEIIVADDLGFANGTNRKVINFVNGVDALAHEIFANESGLLHGGTSLGSGGKGGDQ